MTDLRLTLTVPETGRTVRVVGTPISPEWVAMDVCQCLGLRNPRSSLALIPAFEKGVAVVDTLGGPQEVATVTEAGLFRLVFRSRRPEAQQFQDWVVRDVLPSIRRFGCYPPPEVDGAGPCAVRPSGRPADLSATPARAALALAQAVVILEDRLNALEEDHGRRLARVEANMAVGATDLAMLPQGRTQAPALSSRTLINERVRCYVRAIGGGEEAYRNTWRRLYAELRMRCRFDAHRRAEASGRSPLDEVEDAGLMDVFDAIAAEVLQPPEPSPPERTH